MLKLSLSSTAFTPILLCLSTLLLSAQTLPHIPAIERDVANILNGAVTRPHIPPVRVTADGRVGLNSKKINGQMAFWLLVPEKITSTFVNSSPGAQILSSQTPFPVPGNQFHNSTQGNVIHATICDPTQPFSQNGESTNPYACGLNDNDDCYRVTIIANTNVNDNNHIQLWGTDTIIQVTNPKTASAAIVSVTPQSAPVAGPIFNASAMFEVLTPDDGQLLIGRIGKNNFQWTNPNTNISQTRFTDIVYSVYAATPPEEECLPCDVTKWTVLNPISHAPYDPEMNTRYPFAYTPFVDPEGTLIPDGADLKATYPWVDKKARNLFFTLVDSLLTVGGSTRYPSECPPEGCDAQSEEMGRTRGHGMAGLWTHGKVVMFDNALNNIDYGLRAQETAHRMVSLYEPGTGNGGDGKVRLGSGRDNAYNFPGSVVNTTFLDSSENLFNFWPTLRPVTPRDVVWIVNNGKGSEEVAFDDYLDPNAFILASMAGALSYGASVTDSASMDYHDGWDGSAFTEPIKLQNAATSPGWVLPDHGLVFGNGRLEPAALGGIHGKGLWLDGASGIDFIVADQSPKDVNASGWYLGLFVDCRFTNDETDRVLMIFPDGSRIDVRGRDHIIYRDGSGAVVHAAALPGSLPNVGWAHLGWQVAPGGRAVALLYNGYQLDLWQHPVTQLFRMTPGNLSA